MISAMLGPDFWTVSVHKKCSYETDLHCCKSMPIYSHENFLLEASSIAGIVDYFRNVRPFFIQSLVNETRCRFESKSFMHIRWL